MFWVPDLHVDRLQVILAKKTFLSSGDGHEYLVVRIEPAQGAFGHCGSNDQKIVAIHLDGLADGIFTLKKFFVNRGTQNTYFPGQPHFLGGEEPAPLHLEIRQPPVLLAGTPDGATPVFISVLQLTGLINLGRHSSDQLDVFLNRIGIFQHQRFHFAGADMAVFFSGPASPK